MVIGWLSQNQRRSWRQNETFEFPSHIRQRDWLPVFKASLNTYLFSPAFPTSYWFVLTFFWLSVMFPSLKVRMCICSTLIKCCLCRSFTDPRAAESFWPSPCWSPSKSPAWPERTVPVHSGDSSHSCMPDTHRGRQSGRERKKKKRKKEFIWSCCQWRLYWCSQNKTMQYEHEIISHLFVWNQARGCHVAAPDGLNLLHVVKVWLLQELGGRKKNLGINISERKKKNRKPQNSNLTLIALSSKTFITASLTFNNRARVLYLWASVQ